MPDKLEPFTQATNLEEVRHSDPGRLNALSDGLFAIVLTLLVLELKLPETDSSSQLLGAFIALWPKLFSYFLTFLIAGLYWVIHHRMFGAIREVDPILLWINLMFLLPVGLLPFSTALVGSHGASNGSFSWALYAVNMMLIGLTLAAAWGYASVQGLLDPALSPLAVRHILIRTLITPAIFLLSFVAAFLAPAVAPYTPVLIGPAMWLVARRRPVRPPSSPRFTFWSIVAFAPVIVFALWTVWIIIFHPQGF